jgi:hypothetical protein
MHCSRGVAQAASAKNGRIIKAGRIVFSGFGLEHRGMFDMLPKHYDVWLYNIRG